MNIGYSGKVTLVSPSGDEVLEITIPGRIKSGGKLCLNAVWLEATERQNRRFCRLLSGGWKILKDGKKSPQEKADKGAEGEKGNKPSSQKAVGKTAKRKCRGGQKRRQQRAQKKCTRSGKTSVYCPQPISASTEEIQSAKRSAELLSRLIGRSALKTEQGVRVDVEGLLIALETGDDPLPFLEARSERPKVKVLITPDCSGSCQDWRGLSQAWALRIAQNPDVDVVYFTNHNGEFWEREYGEAWQKLLQKFDFVIYLGDGDGSEMCKRYASCGSTVVGLSCYSAKAAVPRLKREKQGKGEVFWVDRVSAKDPATWETGLRMCLKQ